VTRDFHPSSFGQSNFNMEQSILIVAHFRSIGWLADFTMIPSIKGFVNPPYTLTVQGRFPNASLQILKNSA
jgi:hypothetical protein